MIASGYISNKSVSCNVYDVKISCNLYDLIDSCYVSDVKDSGYVYYMIVSCNI